MLARLVGVSGCACKADVVELVFHKASSGAHSCLGIMCKICRMTISMQIGKAHRLPTERLKAMQTYFGRWLGVTEDFRARSSY